MTFVTHDDLSQDLLWNCSESITMAVPSLPSVGPGDDAVSSALAALYAGVRLRRSVRTGSLPCPRVTWDAVLSDLDVLELLSRDGQDLRPTAIVVGTDVTGSSFVAAWQGAWHSEYEPAAEGSALADAVRSLYDDAPTAVLFGCKFLDAAGMHASALARAGGAAYAGWVDFAGRGIDGCLYVTPCAQAQQHFRRHFPDTRHALTLALRKREQEAPQRDDGTNVG